MSVGVGTCSAGTDRTRPKLPPSQSIGPGAPYPSCVGGQSLNPKFLSYLNFCPVISTVVAERDHLVLLLDAIKDDAGNGATVPETSNGDVMERFAIAVMNLE